MTTKEVLRLKAMIGDYPITAALKKGEVCSDLVSFDFAEVKVAHDAFKRTVCAVEWRGYSAVEGEPTWRGGVALQAGDRCAMPWRAID